MPSTEDIIASEGNVDKCSRCQGSKCCQYVTEPVETPRSMHAFDHLLWQVSHVNTHLYKDDDGWYLLFLNSCEHLLGDGRCGIYEIRPQICREHSSDACEFDTTLEAISQHYFYNFKQLDEYCRKRFKTWDKRFELFEKA